LDIEKNKFILFNDKALELYGYTKKEFENITPYDLTMEFNNSQTMKQEEIINNIFNL